MGGVRVASDRDNNFDAIRLLAAFLVLAGHMSALMATSYPYFLNQKVNSLGVEIFFLIGGYLITKS